MRLAPVRFLAVLLALAALSATQPAHARYEAEFRAFLSGKVVPAARAAGVPQSVIDRELSGLTPDERLPGLSRPDRPEAPLPSIFRRSSRLPAAIFRTSSSAHWPVPAAA
ncbi:hypothetical protein V6L77_13010 [Pannonibacter sp. Pt2-lr]